MIQIKEDNAITTDSINRIDSKFAAATDTLEQEFRRKTVGLVSADDFKKVLIIVHNNSDNNNSMIINKITFISLIIITGSFN